MKRCFLYTEFFSKHRHTWSESHKTNKRSVQHSLYHTNSISRDHSKQPLKTCLFEGQVFLNRCRIIWMIPRSRRRANSINSSRHRGHAPPLKTHKRHTLMCGSLQAGRWQVAGRSPAYKNFATPDLWPEPPAVQTAYSSTLHFLGHS